MHPDARIYVTRHAVERFRSRVDRRGSWPAVAAALAQADPLSEPDLAAHRGRRGTARYVTPDGVVLVARWGPPRTVRVLTVYVPGVG